MILIVFKFFMVPVPLYSIDPLQSPLNCNLWIVWVYGVGNGSYLSKLPHSCFWF
jgi:hypothetical protein